MATNVSIDYVTVQDSVASGATWYAGPLTHSTNGGNNTGWTFTAPPGAVGNTVLGAPGVGVAVYDGTAGQDMHLHSHAARRARR